MLRSLLLMLAFSGLHNLLLAAVDGVGHIDGTHDLLVVHVQQQDYWDEESRMLDVLP